MSNDRLLKEWLNPDCGYFLKHSKLLAERNSPFQHIEVYETPYFGRLLRIDGCFMTSEKEEYIYHENLVHVAALTHPEPKNVLIIGGGDGGSSEETLKHPSVEKIDLVELDPVVIEISKQYLAGIHANCFNNPRLTIHNVDGLEFLRTASVRYDLILLDLTDPVGPASELYTPQFYSLCKDALNENGLLSLHIGSPIFRPDLFQRNLQSLKTTFSVVSPFLAYIPLYGSLWGMACASQTSDPRLVNESDIIQRLGERDIQDLQYYNAQTHVASFALPNFVQHLCGATYAANTVNESVCT